MPMVFANTHIHWNPAMCDVKLMQVAFLLEAAETVTPTYIHTCYTQSFCCTDVLVGETGIAVGRRADCHLRRFQSDAR
jgi:hypothetical protein